MKNDKEILSQEQLNKLAKRRSFKVTLIFAVALIFLFTILIVFPELYNGSSVIAVLIGLSMPSIILIGFVYVMYRHLVKIQLESNQSVIFCKSYLPIGQQVEVIPIKALNYQGFILGLTDKATFYAIHSATGNILVYVQLYEEEPLRKLEEISEQSFMDYYKLKNER